jgi:hypothetical protein
LVTQIDVLFPTFEAGGVISGFCVRADLAEAGKSIVGTRDGTATLEQPGVISEMSIIRMNGKNVFMRGSDIDWLMNGLFITLFTKFVMR